MLYYCITFNYGLPLIPQSTNSVNFEPVKLHPNLHSYKSCPCKVYARDEATFGLTILEQFFQDLHMMKKIWVPTVVGL